MIPHRLNAILAGNGLSRRALARGLGLDPSTITHWLSHGRRPLVATAETVTDWLVARGVAPEEAAGWDSPPREVPDGAATPTDRLADDPSVPPEELGDPDMLLRRQPIHQAARNHFGLRCDPFARDLETAEDVYITQDIRYVREAMRSTATHGGLLAVVGESGSGKTTLLDDMEDWISREDRPMRLIRPDVTGMEASDRRGRTLRVAHIQEAILHGLAPDARLRQSPEARANQVRDTLIAARESGLRVCVAVDEGHAIPVPTLKHFKRLLEIKQGFHRLLSIILLGQPELGMRLSPRNPEVREVVQRCEVVTLDPLDDDLEGYLAHKLAAAGRDLRDLIPPDAIDALRERLGITGPQGQRTGSRAYPLAVGNLVAAAINLSAEAGAPVVTAAAVRRV